MPGPADTTPDVTARATTELRITSRCQIKDLGAEADKSLEDLVLEHPIVEKFQQLRSVEPEGVEVVRSASDDFPVYSLHWSRYRGATWHDRDYGVCWLLACGKHTDGDRNDAYEHFSRLAMSGNLYPTVADYERLIIERNATLVSRLVTDARALLELARARASQLASGTSDQEEDADPGVSAVLGGLLPVTIAVQTLSSSSTDNNDDQDAVEEIWIGFSRPHLRRGWLELVQLALVPRWATDYWEPIGEFLERPLRRDELAYRHFHDVDALEE